MPTVTRDRRDAELLAAFAATQDNAAFAELVRRHGPLVYGVCRRVLADSCEADDAYQAVLIVLARKAGTVRDPGRLAPWLYGVAVRCARRARGAKLVRRSRESPMPDLPARAVDADWTDVRPVLDAEVDRLPDKLRAALVLCELQGVGRAEAAMRLGVPEGTVSSRLARAKDALRIRLTRRGVTLSAVGLAAMLGRAQAATAGLPAAGTPSAAALTIAHAETTMLLSHGLVKVALTLLTAAGLTLAGIALIPVAPPAKLPADAATRAEQAKLTGTWRLTKYVSDGQEDRRLLNVPPDEQYRAVVIDGVSVDFLPSPIKGKYTVSGAGTLKHIDFVDDGGDFTWGTFGVYKLDEDPIGEVKLTIHTGKTYSLKHSIVEPRDSRPADFECKPGGGTVLFELTRESTDPKALDPGKLVGAWTVESVTCDGSAEKGKTVIGGGAVVFTDDRIKFAQVAGEVRYNINPRQSPKHLNISQHTQHGQPADFRHNLESRGIYKLDGDKLTWHFARFAPFPASSDRPSTFDPPTRPGTGFVLVVLRRAKPAPAPSGQALAPAGALSGQVRVNGQPATSGRVTVYVAKAEFVGSLVVGGAYAISQVPEGSHRVVVEAEAAGVTEATTLTKEFMAGERSTQDFDLKPR